MKPLNYGFSNTLRCTLVAFFFVVLVLPVWASAQTARLRPSKEYWGWLDDNRPPKIQYFALKNRQRLAVVGDSLYMLNARNRILWQWDSGGPPFNDSPFIDSNGIIYLVGQDLLWVAIDSSNGKEKWRGTANGRASYIQLVPYKDDMYFVVVNLEAYRHPPANPDTDYMDQIRLCRGNSILWDTVIPNNGTLRVRGERVTVVATRKNRTITKRIVVPRNLSKPIGRVSALADYN